MVDVRSTGRGSDELVTTGDASEMRRMQRERRDGVAHAEHVDCIAGRWGKGTGFGKNTEPSHQQVPSWILEG